MVAPFAGAWIEIARDAPYEEMMTVAPFAGAWIEITVSDTTHDNDDMVAPFAGAWIEI